MFMADNNEFKADLGVEVNEADIEKVEERLRKIGEKKIKITADTESVKESEKVIDNVDNTIKRTTRSTRTFWNQLKQTFSYFTSFGIVATIFGNIRKAANNAVDAVKELNEGQTDLRIAIGANKADAAKLIETYNQTAQAIGATTKEVSDSAVTWLRQGKSIEEANTLIRDSMILSKVAMLDSDEAATLLTSSMKGYKISTEDAISIVDKLTAVDANAAVNAGELAKGMAQTAVTANNAGVSMNTLIGYLATVGEVTQKDLSSIGNAFKTIFTRMADIKAEKLELIDEDGTTELLSNVETTLKNAGIDLRKTVTEFNSFEDVIANLAGKWESLNDIQQAALTKAFAGTRQGENFKILMNNFDNVSKYADVAANSTGNAEKKFAGYADSIEAKTKTMQAAFEHLANNNINQEVIGNIYQATTALIQFIDKTNVLKGVFGGTLFVGAIKGFTLLKTGITSASMKLNQFSAALKILKSGDIGRTQIRELANLTANLSQSQLKAVLSSKALTAQQRIAILTAQGMSRSEAEATLSTMGLAAAETTASGVTRTFSGTLKGLWATIKANPIGVIFTVISAAVMAFQTYNDSVKQMQENAVTALNDTDDHIKEIESNLKNYFEVAKNSNATDNEKTEALKAVVEQLNNKTSALQNATEAEEGYIKAVKNSIIADYKEAARTAKDSRITAQDKINDNNWSWNSQGKKREIFNGNDNAYNDYVKPLLEASDKIYTRIIPATQAVEISYKSISGNAEEQARGYLEYYNALLEVQTQLRKKAEELGKDGDKILESESYKGLSAILNDETFKPAVDNYLNAYASEIYNYAIAENGIPETIEDFNKLKSIMLEQAGDCTILANAVTDKLNSAYGSLVDTTQETASEIENTDFSIDTNTITEQIKNLAKEIKNIKKAYEELSGIVEDYNTNGNFTLENLETLAELGDDYVNCLFNENGQLQLNKEAFTKLAKAKVEDIRYSMLENAISQINSLSKENETTATNQLAESTGNLTEKTLMLAAANKLAEGIPEEKIRSIIDTYSRWNTVIDSVIDGLDNNTDATFSLKQASDKLKDSLNAEKDALESSKKALESQKKALEKDKDGYEKAINSIKSLIEWTEKYITQTKQDEIKALEEKKKSLDDEIDKQKELLQAERDRAKQEADIADKTNAYAKSKLQSDILSLDDSSAGKKAKKQADENLRNSEKDLRDSLGEYRYQEQIKNLDKMKEENDKYYNNQIDNIKTFLDNEVELHKAACDMIDNDNGELYGKLYDYARTYTTVTESEFNHMWSSAQSAMQEYNTANLGTFELLNNLQGRIYEVDTAIDTVANGITAYEDKIQGVQNKLNDLSNSAVNAMNDIAAAIQTEDKWKQVQAYKPKWYYNWQGVKYNSAEENKDSAIADILRQISAKYGGVYPASASTIYGTIQHYSVGTKSAKSGVSEIDENGNIETLMKKTPNGNYVVMDKGDRVFTKEQTDNLHEASREPAQFIYDNIDLDALAQKGLMPLSKEELSDFGLWDNSDQTINNKTDISPDVSEKIIKAIINDSGLGNITNQNVEKNININNVFNGDVTPQMLRLLEKQEKEIIQKSVDKSHNDFVETVLKGRKWR